MHWIGNEHMIWVALWGIAAIGFLIALGWLLYFAVGGRFDSTDSPEAILRRRYAAGEIDTDEYNRRLTELRKTKNAA